MKQITLATDALYSDPDSVIRQLKEFLGRSTGSFEVRDWSEPPRSACEKDDRREWTEPEEHTCSELGPRVIDLGP